MPRARHIRFARLRPLLLAPVAALLAVGLARASEPAAAAWPPSSALLIGEVVTGGVSASDEFVEIYNASETGASLAGLEVVYVSATGGSVTRKASWGDGASLPSRHHLLVANSAGSYASGADVTYSGGFAASGGALVLRPIAGQPIDAVAWGDAANAYVEGAPTPAPAAGSSVERRPGGTGGNWFDTNDNAADTLIQWAPVAQNQLSSPSPPDPETSASPTQTDAPPASASEAPTASAWVVPSASAAAASEAPASSSTAVEAPASSPAASATPTQIATADPTAPAATGDVVVPIASARLQAVGSTVGIVGTVTAETGRVIDARTLVMQDETGGIAVRLPVGSSTTVRRGDRVEVRGTIAQPYGNQLVQLVRAEDLARIGAGDILDPLVATQLDESVEGRLVRVQGRVTSVERRATATVSAFVESTGATIRIVALRTSGAALDSVVPGQQVIAIGIAGQRATQSDPGYRVWLRDGADLQPGAMPTPTPAPTTTPASTPTPRPTASSTPTPAPSPPLVSIAQARARTGQSVTTQGVTTVRPGLLDADARRITIEDGTGGILVRLPATGLRPQPGDRLRIKGKVGTYYGAPQIAATVAVITSRGSSPAPLVLRDGPIPERLEWRLVRASGVVRAIERNGKAWRAELVLATAAVVVQGDARASIASARLQQGTRLTVIGIVRRPRSNAADRRFTLVPRTPADLVVTKTAGASASSGRSATGAAGAPGARAGARTAELRGASSAVRDVDLGRLQAYEGHVVRVGGLLIARTGFLLTLRDATGTANARLPAAARAALAELSLGEALNVTGRVRKSGPERWEVIVERSGDLVRAGSLEAVANATGGPAALPTPTGLGQTAPFGVSADRRPSAGPLGTAGLVTPVLLLLGLVSAGLWAVGLYLRRRARPEEG